MLIPRLFAVGQQQPVLLPRGEVARFERVLADGSLDTGSRAEGGTADLSVRFQKIARIRFDDGVQLLLPGRYAACAVRRGAGSER